MEMFILTYCVILTLVVLAILIKRYITLNNITDILDDLDN